MKILWVCRHPPLQAEVAFLKQKFGHVEIIQNKDFDSVEEIAEFVRKNNIDFVVPFLPLQLILHLHKLNVPLLFSIRKKLVVGVSYRTAEELVLKNPERRYFVARDGDKYDVIEFVTLKKIKSVKIEIEYEDL